MVKILIVGAGIGGLALTKALENLECEIDIVERIPTFNSAGVGIVLHPNGLEVLARLNLLDQVEALSTVITEIQLVRAGERLNIPLAEVWQGAVQPTRAILRTELHRVLSQGALDTSRQNVHCRLGHCVLRVESRDYCASAHFSDGTTKTYDLIVGADGVHSSVRKSLTMESAAVPANLYYFRWLAEDVIGLEPNTWRTIEQRDRAYGFIPIGRGRIHCFVQLNTDLEPCPRDEACSWLEKAFADVAPVLLRCLRARCGEIHTGFAWSMYPACWGVGRCVLLGDSAHAVSPTLSQGGSLAMEDALVLSLALQYSECVNQAIEVYRSVRQERIAWAMRMSLAQLNSLRRGHPANHTSAKVAISHLRHIYRPLQESPGTAADFLTPKPVRPM